MKKKTKTKKKTTKKVVVKKKKSVKVPKKKTEYKSEGLSNLVPDESINAEQNPKLQELMIKLDETMEEIERMREDNDPDLRADLNNLVMKAQQIRAEIREEERK